MRRSRQFWLALRVVPLTACWSSQQPAAPDVDPVGTVVYSLRVAAGDSLPAQVLNTLRILDGTLKLYPNGTFSETVTRYVSNPQSVNGYSSQPGYYTDATTGTWSTLSQTQGELRYADRRPVTVDTTTDNSTTITTNCRGLPLCQTGWQFTYSK